MICRLLFKSPTILFTFYLLHSSTRPPLCRFPASVFLHLTSEHRTHGNSHPPIPSSPPDPFIRVGVMPRLLLAAESFERITLVCLEIRMSARRASLWASLGPCCFSRVLPRRCFDDVASHKISIHSNDKARLFTPLLNLTLQRLPENWVTVSSSEPEAQGAAYT